MILCQPTPKNEPTMKKIIFFIFVPVFIFAAVSPDNQTQTLLTDFQVASASWRASFLPAAQYVFWSLVTIDMVIEFGFVALKEGLSFDAIFAPLLRKILIVGFFLALFQYSSWLISIPSSLSQLGNQANGVSVDVDSVLNYGIDIVNDLWHGISLFHIGDSLALVITGIILIISFALMSAQLFVTTVKMYALLSVAPLVFSLGGLSQTRQMAYNPIFSIIKVGFELLFLKLFMGLTINKMKDFAANVDTDNNSILTMIAMSILMVCIVQMIQGLVEAILSGSLGSNSTAGLSTARSMMSGATGAATGAVAGAIGMGAAVKAASALTKEQIAGGNSSASTFKNLRSALFSDIGRSMSGENLGGGSIGGRMAFKHSSPPGLSGQSQTRSTLDSIHKRDNEEQAFAASQKE